MKCVVTGVAGFIGSSICDRLLSEGHQVVGVDCFVDYYPREIKLQNISAALKNKNFKLIEASLIDVNYAELLDGVEIIFHQAAQAGVRGSWGPQFSSYCQLNIESTQRLLEAAKGHPTLKKLVYASSSSVYGNAERFPTSESALPSPVSPYGVSKLAAEHLVNLYASQFKVPGVSLRYFTVYGPRQRPEMAFHRFLRLGLEGKEIVVYGTGEQSRDFTFIDDIVSANILVALNAKPGSVFNVGGGTQASINQVLSIIEGHIGTLKVVRQEAQKGDAMHTGADTSKIKQELGFTPRVSLAQGIETMLGWVKEQVKK